MENTIGFEYTVWPLVRTTKEETWRTQEENADLYTVQQVAKPNVYVVNSRSDKNLSHIVCLLPRLGGIVGSCDCYGFLSANKDRVSRSDTRVACIHLVAVARRLGLFL